MMRWFPLIRKEFRLVAETKSVWFLALLLPLWGYRPSYVGWNAAALAAPVGAAVLAYTEYYSSICLGLNNSSKLY